MQDIAVDLDDDYLLEMEMRRGFSGMRGGSSGMRVGGGQDSIRHGRSQRSHSSRHGFGYGGYYGQGSSSGYAKRQALGGGRKLSSYNSSTTVSEAAVLAFGSPDLAV